MAGPLFKKKNAVAYQKENKRKSALPFFEIREATNKIGEDEILGNNMFKLLAKEIKAACCFE